MKQLTLLLGCMLTISAWGQRSIGMTLGRHQNWGQKITWEHVAASHPTNSAYDSASHAKYQGPTSQLRSNVWLGAHYRVQPKDTAASMHNWSWNYWLQIGGLMTDKLVAHDTVRDNSNLPYTIIFQGDTAAFSLDSVAIVQHELYGRGGFGQLGFGLMRIVRTETRVMGELGFRLNAGFGQLTSNYSRYSENYLADTMADAPQINPDDQVESFTRERNNLLMASFELAGGIIIPLEKGDNTWWLSIHGSAGINAMNYMGTTVLRVSFVPTLGINYRFLPHDEREQHMRRLERLNGDPDTTD